MVEKAVGSTYTQIVYGPQGRFASMNGQTLVKAFIPAPGAQVVYTSASLNTTNKIAYYRHADDLGSSRLATTPSRTLYSSTAYAPFGEAYSQSGTTDLSFTGQGQDTVSGIYDFPARKYPPVQGRWIAPDPAGLAAANPANPQSWNRYAYVVNNPLSLVDPLGLTGGCPGEISAGCAASGQPDLAAITGSAGSGMMGLGGGFGGFGLPSGIGGMGANGIFAGDEVFIPNLPLAQALWQAVGLPSGLSCPDVGGLSSYLCGGVNPIMDATRPSWCPSGDACDPGSSGLDLSPKAIKCTLSGIGTLALDYAGFIPGEGIAHALFGIGLGMVSTPISAVNGDTTGALGGIAGIHLSALEMTGSKAVSQANMLLNVAQTIRDNKNIAEDYNKCMSGGG